jgi:hypothetical protein
MNPTLQYVVSWARHGAQNAQDPRLLFFGSLYKSSSIDPHTIIVKQAPGDKLIVKARLMYQAPDIAALKNKKLVMKRDTKDVSVTLGGTEIESEVFISFSRSMFKLSLEEVLLLCNLYTIFSNKEKAKLFQKLIQGEN